MRLRFSLDLGNRTPSFWTLVRLSHDLGSELISPVKSGTVLDMHKGLLLGAWKAVSETKRSIQVQMGTNWEVLEL